MYFLPRNNRYYSALVRLSALHRYMLTIGILVGISIVWYRYVYTYVHTYIGYYEQEKIGLLATCKNGEQAQDTCIHLEQELQELQNKTVEYDVTAYSHQEYIEQLLQAVYQARLVFNGYEVQQAKMAPNTHFGVHVEVSGTLEQLLYFFECLFASKQSIICESVRFASAGHDKTIKAKCTLAWQK